MNADKFPWQDQMDELKKFYEILLDIAVKQQQLIEPQDELSWPMDAVLELQNERQDIMQRIDKDFSEKLSLANLSLSADDQAVYSSKADEIRIIIAEIQKIDRSCHIKLQPAMKNIKGKIAQTRQNEKAQLAYDQGSTYNPAWFFDKKQ